MHYACPLGSRRVTYCNKFIHINRSGGRKFIAHAAALRNRPALLGGPSRCPRGGNARVRTADRHYRRARVSAASARSPVIRKYLSPRPIYRFFFFPRPKPFASDIFMNVAETESAAGRSPVRVRSRDENIIVVMIYIYIYIHFPPPPPGVAI